MSAVSRPLRRLLPPLAALAAVTALAACGGSGSTASAVKSTTVSSSTSRTATAPSSAAPSAAAATTARIASGPLHASLRAPNHHPRAGKPWPYSVHVSDATGKPLSGSVRIEFALGGVVVGTDTPPVHPIRHGLWHDTLVFPATAAGHPLTFVAIVQTPAGAAALGWPVNVSP